MLIISIEHKPSLSSAVITKVNSSILFVSEFEACETPVVPYVASR